MAFNGYAGYGGLGYAGLGLGYGGLGYGAGRKIVKKYTEKINLFN
jgi:hypothetical protein